MSFKIDTSNLYSFPTAKRMNSQATGIQFRLLSEQNLTNMTRIFSESFVLNDDLENILPGTPVDISFVLYGYYFEIKSLKISDVISESSGGAQNEIFANIKLTQDTSNGEYINGTDTVEPPLEVSKYTGLYLDTKKSTIKGEKSLKLFELINGTWSVPKESKIKLKAKNIDFGRLDLDCGIV